MAMRLLTARALVLAGCGSPAASDESPEGQAQPQGGCPLTPEALSRATSLSWELREKPEGPGDREDPGRRKPTVAEGSGASDHP
ncbi:hypothetical protein [Streptosporangium sp. CA-115845]|uniref:hypothetical protein n=1 Tax=Streptosporangium sp. CA-115845 TaxID=3240071 RepID=UPI003D929142